MGKGEKEVDKWLADPKLKDKEKPLPIYGKWIYIASCMLILRLSSKYPDAAEQAMDALNKYAAIDPSLKQMKEQNFAVGVGNLYTGSLKKEKMHFQNKDWPNAFKYFSQAEKLGEFLLVNKLSSNTATVDTITVLYTAYSAQNAQQLDTAAKYYSMLADIKVTARL